METYILLHKDVFTCVFYFFPTPHGDKVSSMDEDTAVRLSKSANVVAVLPLVDSVPVEHFQSWQKQKLNVPFFILPAKRYIVINETSN